MYNFGFILDLLIFWVNDLYNILFINEFLLEFDIFVIIVMIDSGMFILIFLRLLFLVLCIEILWSEVGLWYLGILICFLLFKYCFVNDFLFFIIFWGVLLDIICFLCLLVLGFIFIK